MQNSNFQNYQRALCLYRTALEDALPQQELKELEQRLRITHQLYLRSKRQRPRSEEVEAKQK